MYFKCSFRDKTASNAARSYAKFKLKEVIDKYTREPVGMELVFRGEGVKDLVRMTLQSDRFFSATLSAEGYGYFHAIDNLVAKLKNVLRKRKERVQDLQHHHKALPLREATLILVKENEDQRSSEEAIDAEEVIKYEEARVRRLANF